MSERVTVYCAGKIRKNDWRHELFPDLRGTNVVRDSYSGRISIDRDPPSIGRIEYAGPFFIACDHGCYHGEATHGVGSASFENRHDPERGVPCMGHGLERKDVIRLCCDFWLRSADLVYAWLDDRTAYGTLTELGCAHAYGKPILIASDSEELMEEMWFPASLAEHVTYALDAVTGFWSFAKTQALCPLSASPALSQYWAEDWKWFRRTFEGTCKGKTLLETLGDERHRPGFVYLIRAENGLYKIGRAERIDHRFKGINLTVPFEIALIHQISAFDSVRFERACHLRWCHKHVKGEWYRLEEMDVRILQGITTVLQSFPRNALPTILTSNGI